MESGMVKADQMGVPEGQSNPYGDPLMGFSEKDLLDFLRKMLLFRRFEEKAEEAYAIGKIGGFCHLHIGQEGSAAGAIGPLRPDDYLIAAYREHTQALSKGMDPRAVMAELYGKASGSSVGKGGSMHLFGVDQAFMGGHGIVGGQVPLAIGMGWAIKYRGEDRVTMCFMGEAAVNQGAFHESLNMAAIWQLPVIFVVENNEYGMGTAFGRVSATRVEERSAA
jgi:pyruvate dehydrogenase E1 component alpha subunit